MEDDYYSIDAILASNQKLQCIFSVDVSNLGYLDGGTEEDIKVGTKIQLPYWMASILLLGDYADFTIPAPFSSRVKNALNAEPRSVRLSGLVGGGGQWYGFGKMIAHLLQNEQSDELINILMKTFQQRLVDVMDQAQHFGGSANSGSRSGDTGAEFREGLEATERALFSLAQDVTSKTRQWYESTEKKR
ncbi:GINS complex, Psf3 component [Hysterangium stoloniferum]|nr:GINS complex, Psf3 component [Hysterangium stoloniferum]